MLKAHHKPLPYMETQKERIEVLVKAAWVAAGRIRVRQATSLQDSRN